MATFMMRISDTDNDLGKSMQTIITDVTKVEGLTLNRCANIIKTRVEGNLKALKKTHYNKHGAKLRRPRDIHMADDVVIRSGKDKYGYRYVKVQGGKSTGTLWHIVNDGTFRNTATHFMDNAMSQAETDIQSIIDEELRKVFE